MTNVIIKTSVKQAVDIELTRATGSANSFDLSDLTEVVNNIVGIEQFCAYAGRNNEAEALTAIKGSKVPVNNGAAFSNDGFTGDAAAAYINSKWSPRDDSTWGTQMWCGWVKGWNGSAQGALVGLLKYIDPNYAAFTLYHSWYATGKHWQLTYYNNAFQNNDWECGDNNESDLSAYPPTDQFVVYQWTGTQVELWVNGRLVGTRALSGSQQDGGFVYELAENSISGVAQYSSATLGMSGHGQYMSPSQILTLYEAAKAYINKQKGAVIVSDVPTGWDELIAEYGRGYHFPIPDDQTTIYRNGDAASIEATIFAPARVANSLKILNSLVGWDTLGNNNVFGNTNRFTDLLGTQIYADNYKIDHYTGLGFDLNGDGLKNFNDGVDGGLAHSAFGFSDYFSVSRKQLEDIHSGIGNFGFPDIINNAIGTSTTNDNDTAQRIYTNTNNRMLNDAKTTARLVIYCRKHF